MASLGRRNLLLTGLALAATGCARREDPALRQSLVSSSSHCQLPVDGYPTLQEMAEQMAPSLGERNVFSLAMHLHQQGITNPKERTKFIKKYIDAIEDQKITFPAQERKQEATIENRNWQIIVETFEVIAGYKHLAVILRNEALGLGYLRCEAVSANPRRVKMKKSLDDDGQVKSAHHYDENQVGLDLFGNSTLFGRIHNAAASHRVLTPIYEYPIDHATAVNFISRISQLTIEFNAMAVPYDLWNTNSNSYAYSLLKHGLGDRFDEQGLYGVLRENELKVPGYGKLLLSDLKFDSNLLIQPGEENASDVLASIKSKKPDLSADCLARAKTDLVRWQLMPISECVESSTLSAASPKYTPVWNMLPGFQLQ